MVWLVVASGRWGVLGQGCHQAEPVHAEVVADGRQHAITGYDLTPRGIIEQLDLRRPQYSQTTEYGHFGNGFAWNES